jgi:hypothetical protein
LIQLAKIIRLVNLVIIVSWDVHPHIARDGDIPACWSSVNCQENHAVGAGNFTSFPVPIIKSHQQDGDSGIAIPGFGGWSALGLERSSRRDTGVPSTVVVDWMDTPSSGVMFHPATVFFTRRNTATPVTIARMTKTISRRMVSRSKTTRRRGWMYFFVSWGFVQSTLGGGTESIRGSIDPFVANLN